MTWRTLLVRALVHELVLLPLLPCVLLPAASPAAAEASTNRAAALALLLPLARVFEQGLHAFAAMLSMLSMCLNMLSMLLHMSIVSISLHMSLRPRFAPGENGEVPRSEQLKMSAPQRNSKAPHLNCKSSADPSDAARMPVTGTMASAEGHELLRRVGASSSSISSAAFPPERSALASELKWEAKATPKSYVPVFFV